MEAALLTKKIYEEGHAELAIAGDYEDYQVRVGLLEERTSKPKHGYLPGRLTSQVTTADTAEKQQVRQAEKRKRTSANSLPSLRGA